MTAQTGYNFELHVFPKGDAAYGLALYQNRPGNNAAANTEPAKVVQVWGDPLRSVMDQVLVALKKNKYRPTDLRRSRQAPFALREDDGVRLGVLFLAVKPLRKLARIEAISEHIRGMELEELYYWYSKSTAQHNGRRARKAFRILIAEE